MAEPIRRTPLSHRQAIASAEGALALKELKFLMKFVLRGGNEIGAPVAAALGGAWAADPLTAADWDRGSILWIGPDERMVIVSDAETLEIAGVLREALEGKRHQLVEVSDYYTVLEISGLPAWKLLSKTTTLDLHPRAFPPGMAAGGTFGHAQAILWRIRENSTEAMPAFRLIVRWSMADYLWCLLAECGREWGLPTERPVSGERLTIA
jgi:sarcosine oxidase subunit gamma